MTPFFSLLFPLFLLHSFRYLKGQNSLSCAPSPPPPFSPLKYLNFGEKLLMRTANHTLQESRHPEVTKNQYYILSSEGRQKKLSARGLLWSVFRK